jgi:hypothetical protein
VVQRDLLAETSQVESLPLVETSTAGAQAAAGDDVANEAQLAPLVSSVPTISTTGARSVWSRRLAPLPRASRAA